MNGNYVCRRKPSGLEAETSEYVEIGRPVFAGRKQKQSLTRDPSFDEIQVFPASLIRGPFKMPPKDQVGLDEPSAVARAIPDGDIQEDQSNPLVMLAHLRVRVAHLQKDREDNA